MYYFIVNPNASNGKGLRVWKKVNKYLLSLGRAVQFESYITEKTGDARRYARALTSGCTEARCLTVIGGDGTMNEVVDGADLDNDLITFSLIPTGVNNDFARCFRKHYHRYHSIQEYFRNSYETSLDYGVLSYQGVTRRFVGSCGIGFDAAVFHDLIAQRANGGKGVMWSNHITFYFSFLKELKKARRTRGYVILDDETKIDYSNILFISCHVHPYECGCKLGADADAADGFLDICVVSTKRKARLIGIMLSSIVGLHRLRTGVHTFRCRSLQIHTDNQLPVHTDGEICSCATDLTMTCVPQKLRVKI